MWQLVQSQLAKSLSALEHNDKDMAREIIMIEDRVDSSEFLIDSDCRTYMALNARESVDLSFAMTTLKINMHLERIGDIAEDIAFFVLNSKQPFSADLFESTNVLKTFSEGLNLMKIAFQSFITEDVILAKELIDNNNIPENINWNTNKQIIEFVKNYPNQIDQALHILSIIRNLERVFEQIRGITEETISYLDHKENKPIAERV